MSEKSKVQIHCSRSKSSYLAGLLMLISFFISGAALAQSKSEILDRCFDAIQDGDVDRAKRISKEVASWENLFATAVIKQAEQCLQGSKGGYWKYFTTKGRFLSGEDAQAEQAFIDGAADRKKEIEDRREKLVCESMLAADKYNRLEMEFAVAERAREEEVFNATMEICSKLYERDRNSALLEPVCNEIFMNEGLPDTAYAFNREALDRAKRQWMLVEMALNRSIVESENARTEDSTGLARCRAILGVE